MERVARSSRREPSGRGEEGGRRWVWEGVERESERVGLGLGGGLRRTKIKEGEEVSFRERDAFEREGGANEPILEGLEV